MGSINNGVREYPVAELFLREVLQRLGRRFIALDGQQAAHVLTVMLARPGDADMLGTYFSPALLPTQFADMYKKVSVSCPRCPSPRQLPCPCRWVRPLTCARVSCGAQIVDNAAAFGPEATQRLLAQFDVSAWLADSASTATAISAFARLVLSICVRIGPLAVNDRQVPCGSHCRLPCAPSGR